MTPQQLFDQIRQKRSCLCVGLDTDIRKIPPHLLREKDPVYEFNRRIIHATAPYAVAYKPNLAFYESLGAAGWQSLYRTLEEIPEDIFVIADAKRGDIGNTASLYARTFFETFDFDALTVAPYMGRDSVSPFLEYEDKWVFLLALTSNPGSADFQYLRSGDQLLYETVITQSLAWAKDLPGHLGFVTGATHPQAFAGLRALAPDSYFLVPGVGEQGGDLQQVMQHGSNSLGGLLINSSRGIIYAGSGDDFDEKAALSAQKMVQEMKFPFPLM
ncbi:MAG: orotidine-5'-phosphate decarboxylase [Bacteroidetes bacterium]|nr:MAG: orotidine-5'-phosphate decarboxylase [Bacteroidota bacterium]